MRLERGVPRGERFRFPSLGLTLLVALWVLPVAKTSFSQSPNPQPKFVKDPSCGPRSMWYACSLLGIPAEIDDIATKCGMTEEGTTMRGIRDGARAMGLVCDGYRLEIEQLLDLDTPAILFLDGNHFACVDPRKPSPKGSAKVLRMYGGALGESAIWIDPRKLVDHWKGETLTIRPPQTPPRTSGPCLALQSILIDLGTMDHDAEGKLKHDILVKNSGTEDLLIRGVKTSCGCAKAVAAAERIEPGQSTVVKLSIDLPESSQSPDLTLESMTIPPLKVSLLTNDPVRPLAEISLVRTQSMPPWISRNHVALEEGYPGAKLTGKINIKERGDQTLLIQDAKLEFLSVSSESEVKSATLFETLPTAAASITEIDPASAALLPGLPEGIQRSFSSSLTNPQFYAIDFEVSVPTEQPPGTYYGMLSVKTSDPNFLILNVPVSVQVASSSWTAIPETLNFGILSSDRSLTKQVKIESRSPGAKTTIEASQFDGSAIAEYADIETVVINENDSAKLSLTLKPKEPFPKLSSPRVVHGTGTIHLQGGEDLKVAYTFLPKIEI